MRLYTFLPEPALSPTISGYVPITHDGNAKWLVGTDGARLYFGEFLTSGPIFAQISTSGGEVARVPAAAATMSLLDVSPDGSTLLAADEIGPTSFSGYLWEVPVLGGAARKLGNAFGQAAAWSPDGKMIVYANERDLLLANRDGSQPYKLIALPHPANDRQQSDPIQSTGRSLGSLGRRHESACLAGTRLAHAPARMLWQMERRRKVFRLRVAGKHLGARRKRKLVWENKRPAGSVDFRAHELFHARAQQGW